MTGNGLLLEACVRVEIRANVLSGLLQLGSTAALPSG